jgi:RNA polymerase sigma factor (sigma-70 family)
MNDLVSAQKGNRVAFREIIKEHKSMVFSMAWYYIYNRELAEDIAQEVFIHLYGRIKDIRDCTHLRYWLRKATYHRCIDRIRQKGRLDTDLFDEEQWGCCAPQESADPFLDHNCLIHSG